MSKSRPTLGDLDLEAGADVLKPTSQSNRLHLPDADCRVVAANDSRMRPVPAASLWDDTPICEYCLDEFEVSGPGEWPPPVDPTEVAQSDD